MFFNRSRFALFLFFLWTSLFFSAPTQADYYSEPADLVTRSAAIYRGFLVDPNMEWFQRNVNRARGIFIVPQMLRGGFIIGGSGGSGLLLALDEATSQWSYPAFYSMGSVSFGFQAGHHRNGGPPLSTLFVVPGADLGHTEGFGARPKPRHRGVLPSLILDHSLPFRNAKTALPGSGDRRSLPG